MASRTVAWCGVHAHLFPDFGFGAGVGDVDPVQPGSAVSDRFIWRVTQY